MGTSTLQRFLVGLCGIVLFFLQISFAMADELYMPNWSRALVAQTTVDDSYDPFVDFSEFDEASEEEADINFFRNGRFFTLGFIGGRRMMTQGMRNIYKDSVAFGLFLSYFFDLRFAMQLSFITGSHTIYFESDGTEVTGSASISEMGINLKYYLNTQNVTKGLANFNPYFVGGFSQVTRTATVDGEEAFSKEAALAFDIGAGIEIPMLRNKMYFGAVVTYQLVNFNDEQQEIVLDGPTHTGLYPSGDMVKGLIILGINF